MALPVFGACASLRQSAVASYLWVTDLHRPPPAAAPFPGRGRGDKVRNPCGPTTEADLQYGYVYVQEFLPGNAFDILAIIIGNRTFAVRRFNHPGDFRTCGSTGRMDWTPEAISENAIRLAFRVARKLGAQTVAADILHRGSGPVIVELSVNYASWVVQKCPGQWVLNGEPQSGKLTWVDGAMRAEDAIFEAFVGELRRPIRIVGLAKRITSLDRPVATRTYGKPA